MLVSGSRGGDRNLIDGGLFLKRAPLHSWFFRIASVLGAGCVLADIFLIWRYYSLLPAGVVVILGVFVGVQAVYQWWRAIKYYAQIRHLCAQNPQADTGEQFPRDDALRLAAGGITDLLFYGYGMTLVTLIMMGLILAHSR